MLHPEPPTATPTGTPAARPQIGLALVAVLLMYTGQMILNPLIAPLSREVGLAEWQVGLMISSAAITIVLASQFWGRRSQSWGRKRVLVTTMTSGAVAMAVFAVLAQLGLAGILTGVALFVLFVLSRGLLFGLSIAATIPTVQVYIADVTVTEQSRVRGMAGIGAMQGLAMIGGSVAGGLLAGLGLMVPIWIVPVVLAVGAVVIGVRLRPESRHSLVANPPSVSPFDTRVWPFLLAGFGMFTALGFIQIITGFVIQDRFALGAEATAIASGGSLLAAGVGMVLAQTVLVPRVHWRPRRLLRVGSLVALLGLVLFVFDWGMPLLILAIFLVGLGLGIAMPGYSAGASLAVCSEEQGGVAGLLGANNALTFVVAPTAATALYALSPVAPLIVAAAVMAVVAVFLIVHPRFRGASVVVDGDVLLAAEAADVPLE
ncbi:MAG TPA: MFS transporter [Plantibacter sp.]|uniref:MFS transporter n=1 Tax=unclassified Plantibacter TaxID=2624265 RepID=UPI002BED7716|nr:MFS transporter [Plantibacter sp.]